MKRRGRDSTPHVGIYGRRNYGKSSLINALAGQDIAIVSDHPGTTTDPVKKSFEIVDFGPVVLVDTAGIDDAGDLGNKRVEKTLRSIDHIDMALIIVTDNRWGVWEKNLVSRFDEESLPYLIVHAKSDICSPDEEYTRKIKEKTGHDLISFSATTNNNLDLLIDSIKKAIPERSMAFPSLFGDIISPGDLVLLVTPVDAEAPAGRMILPQMQAVRDVLDNKAVAIVITEFRIREFLERTGIKPILVVTDSQAFEKVRAQIPEDMPLTGFSIVLARQKGDFENYLLGTPKIEELKEGDRVLILESCTHQIACDDIGRSKIPGWMQKYTGKKLSFDVVSGLSALQRPVTDYALVVQCGGCMITHRQIKARLREAVQAGIPVTNYGMAIAWMHGIYNRAIAPFATKE
ncbi:MAG TPA: [FeFe] hydrogenase H-cluster maturation GTPase HydF [Bacteroidales bacterium]|nr:[FeFe] hydrogenase H-cluster maturation GTPase HydF [Bacteroidales bacterium]